jgi:hypothetical protein
MQLLFSATAVGEKAKLKIKCSKDKSRFVDSEQIGRRGQYMEKY